MKYLDDLINEAEEINIRFEESKELLLAISEKSKMDKLVYKTIIAKYNMTISTVLVLEDFLRELKDCSDDEEIVSLLIRAKE